MSYARLVMVNSDYSQVNNIPVNRGTVAKNFRRPQPQTISHTTCIKSSLTCSIWRVFWLNITGSCENRVEIKANLTGSYPNSINVDRNALALHWCWSMHLRDISLRHQISSLLVNLLLRYHCFSIFSTWRRPPYFNSTSFKIFWA